MMAKSFAGKQERIWSRIYEIARSGDYPGWAEIEFELRCRQKIPEVHEMLEDPYIRADIDQLCRDARKAS